MIDPSRLAELPCFAGCSDEERARASSLLEEIHVPAGEEVAVQGDFAYEFFVVERGTAEVRENGIRVGELGRGDFFGELGLMVTGRRTASVISTSPMKLLPSSTRTSVASSTSCPLRAKPARRIRRALPAPVNGAQAASLSEFNMRQALESNGRTALVKVLEQEDPPRVIRCGSTGCMPPKPRTWSSRR